MDSGKTSELRRAAILVWHYQFTGAKEASSAAEITEAEQIQRIERFRLELQKIVGETDEIKFMINGGCIEAEIEDLRFVALECPPLGKQEPLTLITLLGRCASCGAEALSRPFYNFAGLGKVLERFEPGRWHLCYMQRKTEDGQV
jgi:hypothetical protein